MWLLLLAARASAAAWGGAISWLACAEARVLALCSPETELGFCFRIGICGVFEQKKRRNRRAALSKNMLSSPFRIVFFGVFLCVAFRIGFCSVFADSRLSAHAGSCRLRLAFVFQLCAGVGGGGWGDNVHANAACVFCFLLLFPMCRISHRFLRCFCRLSTFCTCQLRLAFVFQLCAGVRGGDGG